MTTTTTHSPGYIMGQAIGLIERVNIQTRVMHKYAPRVPRQAHMAPHLHFPIMPQERQEYPLARLG